MGSLLIDEARWKQFEEEIGLLGTTLQAVGAVYGRLEALRQNATMVAGNVQGEVKPTIYAQRDPQWGSLLLGKATKYTIGSSGCLMCSYASCVTDAGMPMTPKEMNAWLTVNNGFMADSEGQIVNFVFSRGDKLNVLKYENLIRCPDSPAPVAGIEQYIKNGGYVIVQVDFDKRTRKLEQHWVRYLGNGKIADPWYGDISDILPRYKGNNIAEAIWAAAYYKKV